MAKWLYGYIVILLIFFIITGSVFSALKINEIYPAPPSGEKEWVELYNNANEQVDLTNFYLNDLAQNKINIESKIIDPYGFTSANSSSILNNTGDAVFLKNNLNETIDIATYSGSFSSDKTFVSCPDGSGNWYTLTTITKNSSNESVCLALTPTQTPTPVTTPTPTLTLQPSPTPSPTFQVGETTVPTQTPTPESISYNSIYISEAMVYPETGNNEWVEIYNDNDFTVNLENWYLDDLENAGSAPKKFSLTVSAKSYQVFELTSSIFNNDGDQVRLLDFNNNLKDSFEYAGGDRGKTWGRIDFPNDNFCQQELSKGSVNNSCLNPVVTQAPTVIQQITSTNKQLSIANSQLPIENSPVINRQIQSSINNYQLAINNNSSVLGATTSRKTNQINKSLTKSLSFLSFSYSLLTIASIFARMNL